MRLLVIPARGGSKRIPRKNVRSFAGKPMITWSIEAALSAQVFDRVVVSTDDEEIAAAARAAGAEVPFLRTPDLADDFTGTRQVVQDAIHQLTRAATSPDPSIVGCLYATAPLVAIDDLRTAVDVLEADPTVDVVLSVARYATPIYRAFEIADGRLRRAFPQYGRTRSQDLPATYHDAGQFYIARTRRWLDDATPLTHEGHPIVIPPDRAVDIDDEDDWRRAERAFASRSTGRER